MNATKTKAKGKAHANGRYSATFRWGRSGEANVPAELSKNDHGWFCDWINGQSWKYPSPANPWSGCGWQVAKDTPREAIRGFLKQWGDCPTSVDHVTLTPSPLA